VLLLMLQPPFSGAPEAVEESPRLLIEEDRVDPGDALLLLEVPVLAVGGLKLLAFNLRLHLVEPIWAVSWSR